ncbi:unnamed protein product [Sphenostylis stenocarpa]|uniref:Uncharacterized protein n=1 Tax=Sphenostylis stenocarpa TaxID=92480 RepID=A0AA86VKQ9_9FABA|nr:unnamed protein product [Sphenostylis stenocarpa]
MGFPLKHVMDSVDAVDWGLKGSFVAVARKSVLSILSAKFEERVSIALSFGSWIGDSAANDSIKADPFLDNCGKIFDVVEWDLRFTMLDLALSEQDLYVVSYLFDSVKWIRPDSIVIGCVQLTEDDKEENYLVQVIRSRHGEINDLAQVYPKLYPTIITTVSIITFMIVATTRTIVISNTIMVITNTIIAITLRVSK